MDSTHACCSYSESVKHVVLETALNVGWIGPWMSCVQHFEVAAMPMVVLELEGQQTLSAGLKAWTPHLEHDSDAGMRKGARQGVSQGWRHSG